MSVGPRTENNSPTALRNDLYFGMRQIVGVNQKCRRPEGSQSVEIRDRRLARPWKMPFVEAARAAGMVVLRVAIRHVLPNTLAPLIVLATAQLGSAILVEASLSFLGLGVPEPHPSWGRMLSENAAEYARVAPWLVIFPGLAISFVVFGTNLLGDALRDILDPRQRS